MRQPEAVRRAMTWVRRRAAVAAVVVTALACSPATAASGSLSSSAGPVSATATYSVTRAFDPDVLVSDIVLTVTPADGRPARTFTTSDLRFQYPDNVLQAPGALRVADLNGDGDPEVVLDSFWNGAHCCYETRVASWSATAGGYVLAHMLWGNSMPRRQDLDADGVPEFVGFDDRFAYALGTSYAGSAFARRIWAWQDGKFVDVTRRYPRIPARALPGHWAEYVRRRNAGLGELASPLAAYLADAYSAGGANSRVAWRRVIAAEGARNPRMLRGIRNQLTRLGYIR